MATTRASDIVSRAYRTTNLVRLGEVANAAQLEEGLIYLNEMLDDWAENEGIDLGMYDLAADDEIHDSSVVRCLRYNLAMEVAEGKNRAMSPRAMNIANRTKRNLAVLEFDTTMEFDEGLQKRDYSFSIRNDYY